MKSILSIMLIMASAALVLSSPAVGGGLNTPTFPNSLYLQPNDSSRYVRAGETVTIALSQANVTIPTGYQAFLWFDATMLTLNSVTYTPAPYDMRIIDPARVVGSNIDLAAGRIGATSLDADLAFLSFTVPQSADDGTAHLRFRQSERPTTFTDVFGNEVTPTLADCSVVIDNTPPSVPVIGVAPQTSPGHYTASDSAILAFSSSDVTSGIDHYELSKDGATFITVSSPYTWSGLSSGTHTAAVKAVDRSGNESQASVSIYVDRTGPTLSIDSAKQGTTELIGSAVRAIQGDVIVTVSAADGLSGLPTPPTVKIKDAAGVEQTLTATGSGPWTYTYSVTADTANGVATITASATDVVGNLNTATAAINVNKSTAALNIQLLGVSLPSVTRTLKLVIGGAGGTVAPIVINRSCVFTNGQASVLISDLSNDGAWVKVSAKDEQHTLRKTVDLTDPTGKKQYQAALALTGGDANNDNLIDIRDFGIFSGQYGSPGHPFTGRDADFSCDGEVWSEDYTFIQIKFLQTGDAEPQKSGVGTQSAGADSPKSAVSVTEMGALVGNDVAASMDVNQDGIVDLTDMSRFLQTIHSAGKRQ